jgi:hypothetical protein
MIMTQHADNSNGKVMLMQAKVYPDQLVKPLLAYFKTQPEITRVYLSLIQGAQVQHGPDYLLAIQVAGDVQACMGKVNVYLQGAKLDTGGKQLALVDAANPMFMQYFQQIEPFYEKTAGSNKDVPLFNNRWNKIKLMLKEFIKR